MKSLFKIIIQTLFLLVTVSRLNASQVNCPYLEQLAEDATETQQRAALISCRELMEQKTLLLAAEVKYKEIKQQLAAPNRLDENMKTQDNSISDNKMISSDQIFLLSVSGFKKQRRIKLFYRGNYYFLAEGERFPGGKIISTDGNSVKIFREGKTQTIHLTTVVEMQLALGLSAARKKKKKPMPLGRNQ